MLQQVKSRKKQHVEMVKSATQNSNELKLTGISENVEIRTKIDCIKDLLIHKRETGNVGTDVLGDDRLPNGREKSLNTSKMGRNTVIISYQFNTN